MPGGLKGHTYLLFVIIHTFCYHKGLKSPEAEVLPWPCKYLTWRANGANS